MHPRPALHVVSRSDGVWQVEREDALVPLSLHADREEAIDAALLLASRERCPLLVHRLPRQKPRWVDREVWALLDHRAPRPHGRRAG